MARRGIVFQGTNEAAAGKNPVSHVGKIYNLLSHRIAQRIYDSLDAVEEVYVWLVSQIGRPLNDPWCATATFTLKEDAVPGDVEPAVEACVQEEIAEIDTFCAELVQGTTSIR